MSSPKRMARSDHGRTHKAEVDDEALDLKLASSPNDGRCEVFRLGGTELRPGLTSCPPERARSFLSRLIWCLSSLSVEELSSSVSSEASDVSESRSPNRFEGAGARCGRDVE